MSQEEKNKTIAEFMGYKHQKSEFFDVMEHYKSMEDRFPVGDEKYHISWDWLMPVVEKIERTNLDEIQEVKDTMLGSDHRARFNIGNERVIVSIAPNWSLANIFNTDNRLSNTYYCVLEFIKWYNQNKGGGE